MPAPESNRLHYLDALRSTLMLLGVVLHSARPYNSADWRVNNPERWGALDVLGAAVHLFRMPAFFVVAGFFAMYLITRRPTSTFIRERARRTLVPFAVTLVTLNVLQAWFIARHVEGQAGPLWSTVLLPQWRDGQLVSHLWFLVCLAVYFALTAIFARPLRRLSSFGEGPLSPRVATAAVLGLVGVAVFARAGLAVVDQLTSQKLHEIPLGLVMPFTVAEYLPFFAAGLVLCAFPAVMQRFARIDIALLALAAVSGAGIVLATDKPGMVWNAIGLLSETTLIWMTVRALFALFQRMANRPSATSRYLSDASYSVYLFHHVIVIMVAAWLIPVALGPGVKFLLVLVAASVASLALYHLLIRPSALLSYLFNGAIRPGRAAVAGQAGESADAPLAQRSAAGPAAIKS